MSRPVAVPVADGVLVEALAPSVRDGPIGAGEVVRIERRPSEYRSSFALEEVDALLNDGSVLRLVLKDLRPEALHEAARAAKPAFLRSPRREIGFYRSVIPGERPGTARLHASEADEARDRFWILLERVPGMELYQCGDLELWREAARWLARFHGRFSAAPCRLEALAAEVGLIRHDAGFYRTWIRRARAIQHRRGAPRAEMDRLAEGYERGIERLLSLPRALIHGEFYASNVLVDERAGHSPRVCPVDWETASVGPGLVDLAALVAGGWSEEERAAIARAYRDEWASCAPAPLPAEDFRPGLDLSRLHLAVQWLGWSDRWTPPREHAQDWLGGALELVERLGL